MTLDNRRLSEAYESAGGILGAFSDKAADYAISRPDYPAALFATLKTRCPPGPDAVAVDIGAGTGLLTQGLLQAGYRVVAVEPNAAMRAAADARLGENARYRSVEGKAEAIPLPNGVARLIAAAQAFHWFDVPNARKEFRRILDPGGWVAIIWNDRVPDDPVSAGLNALADEFGGSKREAVVAQEDPERLSLLFGGKPPERLVWPHEQRLGLEPFLGLAFSRSYMPRRDTPEGASLANRMRELFDEFSRDGLVRVAYRTSAFIGTLGG